MKREIERVILRTLKARGTATSSLLDLGRAWSPENPRAHFEELREAAARLSHEGRIEVFRHGRPADPLEAVGPLRFRAADVSKIDHRKHPERYRVGRGEEGVLTVEPYKSELLPLWRFRTEALARESSRALWAKFVAYRAEGDFVGMDMARKFIQMGWTRARRYANHAGGRKYGPGRKPLPPRPDDEKARAAQVFRRVLDRVLRDRTYAKLKAAHAER